MEKLHKGYVYRIYPTEEQKEQINKNIGCARKIYNLFLQDRTEYYKIHKEALHRNVTYYKSQPEYAYLSDKCIDSLALKNAKRHLETAFEKFFAKKAKYPKFKRKGVHDSYTTDNQGGTIAVEDGKLRLPKFKKTKKYGDNRLRLHMHRELPKHAVIKNCTVSKHGDQYYVSICIEFEETINYKPKERISELTAVGIDYSSSKLYVASDGTKGEYPKFYRKMQKRLAKEQRRLSKKKQHSQNYNKQKARIQKLHTKVANQRQDFLHKKALELVTTYDLICFEDLNLKNISQSLRLGKSTMDNGFGMFRKFVEYKAKDRGKYTIKVGKTYASTKLCHCCGYKNTEITLSTREWECPNCHTVHNRDENAAINIRQEGLRLFHTA